MLPNYNNTKDTSESSNSSETSIIELNNSPNVISLGICLESRKNVRAKTKKNNSKKSPKKEVPKISQKEKNIESEYGNQLNLSSKNKNIKNQKFSKGIWTKEEHEKFIEGVLMYGNEWVKVQEIIKTRTNYQAKSHAQKFFEKYKDLIDELKNKDTINMIREEQEKKIDDIISIILPDKKNLTQNQKNKLLSAISSEIKFEENYDYGNDDSELELGDNDNFKEKYLNNENKEIYKNNVYSFDFSELNPTEKTNKLLGQKRKLSQNNESKDKKLNKKKNESRRDSIDLTLDRVNQKELKEKCDFDVIFYKIGEKCNGWKKRFAIVVRGGLYSSTKPLKQFEKEKAKDKTKYLDKSIVTLEEKREKNLNFYYLNFLFLNKNMKFY